MEEITDPSVSHHRLVLLEDNPVPSAIRGGPNFCYVPLLLGLAQVGSNIALDMLVLEYPLPVISRLHVNIRRKFEGSLIPTGRGRRAT